MGTYFKCETVDKLLYNSNKTNMERSIIGKMFNTDCFPIVFSSVHCSAEQDVPQWRWQRVGYEHTEEYMLLA